MINNELLNWMRQQIANGVTTDQISRLLRTQGWNETDLSEAFVSLSQSSKPTPPVPTPSAPIQPIQMSPSPVSYPHRGLTLKLIGIILLVIIISGTGYAYWKKIGPFSNPPYTQDDLLSGLLEHIRLINTSSYSLSGALSTNPRDADAVPFTLQMTPDSKRIQQYKNDFQRATDMGNLLNELINNYGAGAYVAPISPGSSHTETTTVSYPSSLDKVATNGSSRFYTVINIKDPSGNQYNYSVTGSGKNFKLSVTFETGEAINSTKKLIKSLGDDKGTTIVGQTVTFTKDSSPNLGYNFGYFQKEPPKPYFSQLQDMMAYAPSEMNVSMSIAATADQTRSNADGKLNVDATGNFGDLSYKINADILKKDSVIYLRINNFPSLFGFPPESMRKKWAKIDTSTVASSTSSQDYLSSPNISTYASKAEEEYKKNRDDLMDLLQKFVTAADKTHLIAFKNKPTSDKVDGRTLYRYELEINKGAIAPFYPQIASDIDQKSSYADMFSDPGITDYLQGDEIRQIFDYFNKNISGS